MFHESTHRRHWLLTPQELHDLRSRVHEQIVSTAQVGNKFILDDFFFFSNVNAHKKGAAVLSLMVKQGAAKLDLMSEQALKSFFVREVVAMCTHVPPPVRGNVAAHAAAYLQRHFLFHTVSLYPLRGLMLLCVILACKTCEVNILIDEHVKALGCGPAELTFVRAMELRFLQGIKFHVIVHSPFRSLRGQLFDFRSAVKDGVDWGKLESEAHAALFLLITSDAILIFAPSRIALAALTIAAAAVGCAAVLDRHVAGMVAKAPSPRLMEDVAALIAMHKAQLQPVQIAKVPCCCDVPRGCECPECECPCLSPRH